jgi:eukaryotic-like serine/threonine-protein kinase
MMTPTIAAKSFVFKFADFTVREREFVLNQGGKVQAVEPKAFRVLLVLLRNANKLIAKEELLLAVWGNTAVTENSLARNIGLLRRLLGDNPREPRFIETVSSLGYRFVCPVEVSEEREDDTAARNGHGALPLNERIDRESSREPSPAPFRKAAGKRWLRALVLSGVIVAFTSISYWVFSVLHRPRIPSRAAWARITNFPDSATSPALSPDGKMMAFIRGPDTFVSHGQIYVKILPDGQPVQLTNDELMKSAPAFSPDGSRIAYTTVDDRWNWDTWVVPVLGGQPQKMLPNAASLTWIDAQHVVYSELKSEFSMGVATATESRTAERELYFPAAVDGMAHRSWVSPDRKWMLVAEMDDAGWQPCRLMPFDGSSPGWIAGPQPSRCRTAAWSPDGKTMYFGADGGDGYHLWRQRFPRGLPEQITFGPTEEEGIAVAPDGHWLITSAGFLESTVWVHDAKGDRQVSGEGLAMLTGLGHPDDPWVHYVFSPDGKKLYYLLRKQGSFATKAGELWVAYLDSGRTEAVLPGLVMGKFDILPDGQRVVFEDQPQDEKSHVWVAWLDRRSHPRLLTSSVARLPHLGPAGDVYVGVREPGGEFTYKGGADESPQRLNPPYPGILYLSPHGEWELSGFEHLTARPTRGGSPSPVCDYCSVGWGMEGDILYMVFRANGEIGGGQAVALRLPPGKDLPALPPLGVRTLEELRSLGPLYEVDLAGKASFAPGPNPSIYAYVRHSVQRNLFRIPLN